jgi:hypothetical protein
MTEEWICCARSELLPEHKATLERWAVHVLGLVSGRPVNVVTMRNRKRRT